MKPREIEGGYYYLHTNGNLIFKPVSVVDYDPCYFDSPFVKKFWRLDFTDRFDAWRLILEALSMGCRVERAKELAQKWGLTFEDSVELLKRTPPQKVTTDMMAGLGFLAEKILGMRIDVYWDKVKEEWDGKVDKTGDQGKVERVD